MLLAILDSEGVSRRKSRRMKRRIYQNKVANINFVHEVLLFLQQGTGFCMAY